MTTPVTIDIPKADYPMVTRVIADALFPDLEPVSHDITCPHCRQASRIKVKMEKASSEPVVWGLNQSHPLLPEMLVVRMFIVYGGTAVKIYSASKDGTKMMRNTISMRSVRLVEEVMTPDVFVDEIEDGEAGDDQDFPVSRDEEIKPDGTEAGDETDEGEEHDDTQPPPANGQATV